MSSLRRSALTGLAALSAGAALVAGTASGAVAAPEPAATSDVVELQLLGVNDLHGNLEPPGGSSGLINDRPAGGIAYLAGHLAALRQGHPNSLTVAAGDMIGASPLVSALFHDEPTIEALNALHLDVTSVGNHEFDEGADELLRIQQGGCHPVDGCQTGHRYAGADFPYLSANVVDRRDGDPLLAPYAVEEVDGVKVGFIGVTLEGTPDIVSAEGIADLRFLDEAQTANRYAAELQSQGVESIVLLLHEGGVQSTEGVRRNQCEGISGPVVDIVQALDPAIDAVLSAHTHQAYNCRINKTLVTSAASYGRLVTDITMRISRRTQDVVSVGAVNRVVTRRPQFQDATLQGLVDRYVRRSAAVASRPVGTITEDITDTAGANGESPLGDLVADAQLAATQDVGAVAALMNPGGIRADLVEAPSAGEGTGVVTYGEAFTVQPFNNLLTTVTLTGEQVLAVLEQQYDLGTVLQPAGLTYTADPDAAPGSRVTDVVLAGAPLDPAASYRLTVNSFLAGGGDGFTTLTVGTDVVNSGLDIDAFTAYLTAHPQLAAPAADRITPAP